MTWKIEELFMCCLFWTFTKTKFVSEVIVARDILLKHLMGYTFRLYISCYKCLRFFVKSCNFRCNEPKICIFWNVCFNSFKTLSCLLQLILSTHIVDFTNVMLCYNIFNRILMKCICLNIISLLIL